jgi:hypothetical protein
MNYLSIFLLLLSVSFFSDYCIVKIQTEAVVFDDLSGREANSNSKESPSNCESTSVQRGKKFEEQLVVFHSGNGRKVDLIQENPYNFMPFKQVRVDKVYQMNVYELPQQLTASDIAVLNEVLPGQSDVFAKVRYLNSQVDVVVMDDCFVKIIYGLYGFGESDELLCFTTSLTLLDESGEEVFAVAGRPWGDTFAAFNPSKTAMLSCSMGNDSESKDNTNVIKIRLTDLMSSKKIYETAGNKGERWGSCAIIPDTELLYNSQHPTGGSGIKSMTYFVFDVLNSCVYIKELPMSQKKELVKMDENGFNFESKLDGKYKLEYKKDFLVEKF